MAKSCIGTHPFEVNSPTAIPDFKNLNGILSLDIANPKILERR
jgi:hypothetical protein